MELLVQTIWINGDPKLDGVTIYTFESDPWNNQSDTSISQNILKIGHLELWNTKPICKKIYYRCPRFEENKGGLNR